MTKLYQSEAWLKRRYLRQRKSIEQIAEECSVTRMTIYNQLKKFGIRR